MAAESDIRILKLLLDNKTEKFTIRKIAILAQLNYRIAYEQVLKLEKDGIIKITVAGHSKLCELTYTFDNKMYEAENLRRTELLRNKDFAILYRRLSELDFNFVCVLFGSQAKKTATKHSDTDLLLIGAHEKKISSTIALLPGKIHPTCITYADFSRMAKSKEFSVVSEAMNNNIILIGIEEYYRLLKNVRQE